MKYFTVHNANFAFSLMRLKRLGVRLSDYFVGDESVIIYGCSFFGMELYRELKDDLNVVCFIDRDYDECEFEGIKTFSLFNHKLKEVLKKTADASFPYSLSGAKGTLFEMF